MIQIITVLRLFLMFQEIDHVGYVRQAFEVASLTYFAEILQSVVLKESDVSSVYKCMCLEL